MSKKQHKKTRQLEGALQEKNDSDAVDSHQNEQSGQVEQAKQPEPSERAEQLEQLEQSKQMVQDSSCKLWMARLHELNVCYPWFKILAVLVLVAGIILTILGLLKLNNPKSLPVTQVETRTVGDVVVNGISEFGMLPKEQLGGGEIADKTENIEEAKKNKISNSLLDEIKKIEICPIPREEKPIDITGKKLVALTFDDGPSASTTPRLLDILKQKRVKATFFVVGTMVRQSPNILQREANEGHEVASHTMTHRNLSTATVSDIEWEMAEMNTLFRELIGKEPELIRPPYGAINATVRQTLTRPMILWTVDPNDWRDKNAEIVRSRVVSDAFDGAIILMHDVHSTTVDAVPRIIDDLRAAGYEFLTVSELARVRGESLEKGWAYGAFRKL